MTYESRFTEDEQVMLSSLPHLIGAAMTFAEGSGLGTVKEMMASSRALLSGAKNFANNEIIIGVLPALTNMDEAMAASKEMREKLRSHLQANQVRSNEQIKELALSDATKISALLDEKGNPEEVEEFKNWILDIAEDVSRAAKEGGFLGFGGEQVSEGEVAVFNQIAAALNVGRNLKA